MIVNVCRFRGVTAIFNRSNQKVKLKTLSLPDTGLYSSLHLLDLKNQQQKFGVHLALTRCPLSVVSCRWPRCTPTTNSSEFGVSPAVAEFGVKESLRCAKYLKLDELENGVMHFVFLIIRIFETGSVIQYRPVNDPVTGSAFLLPLTTDNGQMICG